MSLLLEAPRRRGRPPVADDPGCRERHIECAAWMVGSDLPTKRLARILECSVPRLYAWTRLAFTYDDERIEVLNSPGPPLPAEVRPRPDPERVSGD